MPAPFFSYGGARQNSSFVFLSMPRIIIMRLCVNNIAMAWFIFLSLNIVSHYCTDKSYNDSKLNAQSNVNNICYTGMFIMLKFLDRDDVLIDCREIGLD